MVNVVTKRCEEEGCSSLNPTFNFERETKGRFCKDHKEDGMVDMKNKRCEKEGCSPHPAFNFEGEKKCRFCKELKCSQGPTGASVPPNFIRVVLLHMSYTRSLCQSLFHERNLQYFFFSARGWMLLSGVLCTRTCA